MSRAVSPRAAARHAIAAALGIGTDAGGARCTLCGPSPYPTAGPRHQIFGAGFSDWTLCEDPLAPDLCQGCAAGHGDGETITLEALITRAAARAITFVTKRGEATFTDARRIDPYFREQAGESAKERCAARLDSVAIDPHLQRVLATSL